MAPATTLDVEILESELQARGIAHLAVARRGDRLTVSADDHGEPVKIARFRALPRQRWSLDLADHRGRWAPTPYEGSLAELVQTLVAEVPWMLDQGR
jgi:hypothetical protein